MFNIYAKTPTASESPGDPPEDETHTMMTVMIEDEDSQGGTEWKYEPVIK